MVKPSKNSGPSNKPLENDSDANDIWGGRFDGGPAEIMLKKYMVHIIGSDSHGIGKRNFCLKESIKEAQKIIDYDVTPLVSENPRNVIDGKTIEIPEITTLKKSGFLSKLIGKLTD